MKSQKSKNIFDVNLLQNLKIFSNAHGCKTYMPEIGPVNKTTTSLDVRVNKATEVRRRWYLHFAERAPPSITVIKKNVKKFNEEATCHNLNKGRSGHLKTVVNQENIDMVRQSLDEDGKRSSRRNGLGLKPTSFRRIVKEIKFHPYVMVRRQKLKDGDPAQRRDFCNRFLQTLHQNQNFLQNLITSDEAIFSLNSEVNTWNVRCYSLHRAGHPENHYIEFEQGADQVMVWIGVTGAGVILGPHFINGRMNTQEYLRIVRYNIVQREFFQHGIDRQHMWWQQDRATVHTSNPSIRYLTGQFPGKLISKGGD